MLTNELAIDAEGEPFELPPTAVKWRVRRVEGRGKPGIVYHRPQPGQPQQGGPLLLDAGATFAELARKAGPGRYRLDAVDSEGRRLEGVPVAVTGPLETIDDAVTEISVPYDEPAPTSAAPRRGGRVEDLLVVAMETNTRVLEKTIDQLSSLMAGVTGLLQAAHGVGLTSRVPILLPPPPPLSTDERDDDPAAPMAHGMPEWLTVVIQQAVHALVPMIVPKLASLPSLSGMPLAALVDWSRAAPAPRPTPEAQVVTGAAAPVSSASAVGTARPASANPGMATAGPAPAATSRTANGDSIHLTAHITQIWQALSIAEQTRAHQLIALLSPDERTAWVTELGSLGVAEAVDRIRGLLQRQTPAPIPQLPSDPGAAEQP